MGGVVPIQQIQLISRLQRCKSSENPASPTRTASSTRRNFPADLYFSELKMSSHYTPPAGNTPTRRSLNSIYNLDPAWHNKETPLTPVAAPSTAQNKISEYAKKLSLSTFEIDTAKAAAMFALNDGKGHFHGNESHAAETWHNIFTKIRLKYWNIPIGYSSEYIYTAKV